MSTRAVIWPRIHMPLLLEKVRRDANGNILRGFVVNGEWDFEIRGAECLAKAGPSHTDRVLNRWPKPPNMREVLVPDTVRGDYNEVINWAKEQ